ncbi:PTS sugar transporter subunit IIA [Alphaproteobacteria bacterium KMM 3653]|uniref:PTS sugar transporter subunit IIA n=1 Tax=Harenicola maris TaxID=2841044 RepID=A0AAP2CU08_9RHOB|nr:PTS sugar transporter subunit IIA [Harenicola maris]
MDFSSILKPEAVKVIHSASSKKRLFHQLGELVGSAYGFDVESTCEALLDRESLGPTGVGRGVALPHARLEGIDTVAGVFIRLETPLEFDSVDRQPVDLIFALLAPTDSGVDHLKALALVSRTLREASICAKLRANDSAQILHTILTEDPATQAA